MHKICLAIIVCFSSFQIIAQFDSTRVKRAEFEMYKKACTQIDSGK